MKHVHRVRGKDGVDRLYLRKTGLPRIPLKSPWPGEGQEAGSELAREVAALVGDAEPKARPGTLRGALRAYELETPDFANLAESTKASYRGLMKELEEDFGGLPIATFKAPYLLQLRNAWAQRGHRIPGLLLNVLHNVLRPHIIAGELGDGDPFTIIPGVRRPQNMAEPHRIWPEAVVHTVIEWAIREGRVGLARAVAVGRYAGARRGDIVKLSVSARRQGRFAFLAGKRHVPVDMPEDPALAAVLSGTPDAPDSLVLCYNLSGLAYTEDGLHQQLVDLIARLRFFRLIDSHDYSCHGLRHTFGVEAALAGCSDAEGAALLGHASPNSFATYRRQADRIRLSDAGSAQVIALRERTRNGNVENELEKICKTPAPKPAKGRGKSASKTT